MCVDLRLVVDEKADGVEPAGGRDGDERSNALSVPNVDVGTLRDEESNHFRLPEICGLHVAFSAAACIALSLDRTT